MVLCGECGAQMVLRDSKYGKFYGCIQFPKCKGTHGAHPDGKPLGVPANKETKLARMKAHEAFDAMWKRRKISRTKGYAWLQKAMGLTADEAHIAKFTKDQCEKLVQIIEAEKGEEHVGEEKTQDGAPREGGEGVRGGAEPVRE